MAGYLQHTQRSTSKLREAAATIRSQNASLEQPNRLLPERSQIYPTLPNLGMKLWQVGMSRIGRQVRRHPVHLD